MPRQGRPTLELTEKQKHERRKQQKRAAWQRANVEEAVVDAIVGFADLSLQSVTGPAGILYPELDIPVYEEQADPVKTLPEGSEDDPNERPERAVVNEESPVAQVTPNGRKHSLQSSPGRSVERQRKTLKAGNQRPVPDSPELPSLDSFTVRRQKSPDSRPSLPSAFHRTPRINARSVLASSAVVKEDPSKLVLGRKPVRTGEPGRTATSVRAPPSIGSSRSVSTLHDYFLPTTRPSSASRNGQRGKVLVGSPRSSRTDAASSLFQMGAMPPSASSSNVRADPFNSRAASDSEPSTGSVVLASSAADEARGLTSAMSPSFSVGRSASAWSQAPGRNSSDHVAATITQIMVDSSVISSDEEGQGRAVETTASVRDLGRTPSIEERQSAISRPFTRKAQEGPKDLRRWLRDVSEPSHAPQIAFRPAEAKSPSIAPQSNADEPSALPVEGRAAASEATSEKHEHADFVRSFLLEFLDFRGCTEQDHAQEYIQHVGDLAETGAPHQGLVNLNENLAQVPYVLDKEEFPYMEEDVDEACPSWSEALFGVNADEGDSQPPHVCLHKETEECVPRGLLRRFDVDSLLAFANSLAVARRGINYLLIPSMSTQIKTDLHTPVRTGYHTDDGKLHQRSVSINKVPHYMFGRLIGYSEISMYLLFPNMYNPENDFKFLTTEQLRLWTDSVLLPAMEKYMSASAKQHQPRSFDMAQLRAQAKSKESRRRDNPNMPHSEQQTYVLQPALLDNVWTEINRLIETTRGLAMFKGVMILLNGKNLKNETGKSSLPRAWNHFYDRFTEVVDEQHLDRSRTFVDLAKQTTPPDSRLRQGDMRANDPQPQVLLWRKCCLHTHATKLDNISLRASERSPSPALLSAPDMDEASRSDGSIEDIAEHTAPARIARDHQRTFYHECWLRDAGNMTLLPKKSSRSHQAGLRYSQFYALIKGPLDANKTYPFANERVEGLGLDPQLRKAWAKTTLAKESVKTLQQSYKSSARRVHGSLCDSSETSYGLREEHRVSLDLAVSLVGQAVVLEADAIEERQPEILEADAMGEGQPEILDYAYTIRTDVFMQFQRLHINKFCAAAEEALARCKGKVVGFEQTRVMVLFFRCLRYSVSAQALERELSLWCDRRSIPKLNSHRQGVGLQQSISTFGYGWLLPKIDLSLWRFHEDLAKEMLIGNPAMKQAYRKHYLQLHSINDDYAMVAAIRDLLVKHSAITRIKAFLLRILVWLAIQSFKKTLFRHIKDIVQPGNLRAALAGEETLDYDNLRQILREDPHVTMGNRSKSVTLSDSYDFLWSLSKTPRGSWENADFRSLWRNIHAVVDEASKLTDSTREDRAWLRQMHKKAFFLHCWMWPVPTAANLQARQKAKDYPGRKRLWLALAHPQLSDKTLTAGDIVQQVNKTAKLEDFYRASKLQDVIHRRPAPQHEDFDYAMRPQEDIDDRVEELERSCGPSRLMRFSPPNSPANM